MTKIIDVHVHVGNSSTLYVAGSVDAVLTRMDAAGVDGAVISPIPGFEDPEGVISAKKMNGQVARIKKENPARFPFALGVAEPKHGAGALEEVEHALGELKLDGIMFHNDFNGVEVDAPIMFEIIKKISEFPGAVANVHTAFHSDLEPPFMVGRLADAFPGVTFLMGHPLMTLNQTHAIIELAKWYPNLYIDTCYAFHHSRILERVVEAVGSHRMAFGTDNPYFGKLCLDKVLVETAGITQKDKENIFYNTFHSIFYGKEA